MDRVDQFHSFMRGYNGEKLWQKITPQEQEIVRSFLRDNNTVNHDQWMIKVNRLFLDQPKPKNWIIITEILTSIR